MLPIEEINTLVARTGSIDSEILSVTHTADQEWVIEYEPAIIELEYDESRGRLLMQVEIGAVPEDCKSRLYEGMLSVSFLWRETGGLHLALAGSAGEAVLMVDLAGEELNAETIATVAGNLVERAVVWRGIFASAALTGQPNQGVESDIDPALIRV